MIISINGLDKLIFAETFITNNEYIISEIVNINSDKITFFQLLFLG
jgi:hypothetical protein